MRRALPLPMLVAALLVGCGERGPEADLVFTTGDEHNTLDPQKISWVHDRRVADCLYEPLVRVDGTDGTVRPAVAERWEVSGDALTYTFHLRPEARWSNGDPVLAEHFVHAWRRALLPGTAADYTQLLFCIDGAEAFFAWRSAQLESAVTGAGHDERLRQWGQAEARFAETVGLKAPDGHTLVVRLARPTPYFLQLVGFVTFMPVHVPSLEAVTTIHPGTGMVQPDATYFADPQRLVTNGPYVLARRRFKRDLLLVANERYRDRALMRNRSILEKIVSDPQTALLDYEQGGSHWLPGLPTASSLAADLAARQRADVHLTPMAGVYFYNFNCQSTLADGTPNPLADRRVRQALSMAIDRRALVERVTRLNQPLARSFVPPGVVPGYQPAVDAAHGFDPVTARARLAEARATGLQGLSILYNTGAGHETIAQAIKRMWKEHLDIVVVLEAVEVRTFSERLKKGQYTICRASWFGDYRDPTTWLDKMRTANGNNDCAYESTAYDGLLDRAASERDAGRRFATLREAESLMLADAPMAMIFQYVNLDVFDPARVAGLAPNAWAVWELEKVSVRR